MNIPTLLETAISLFALLTIMSILSSSIFELVESRIRRRSKLLHEAIHKALHDPGLNANYAALLYEHPLIKGLQRTKLDYPSYIPPQTFAQALIDVVTKYYENEQLVFNREKKVYELPESIQSLTKEQRFKTALKAIEHSDLGRLLSTLEDVENDRQALIQNLSQWYNGYMERVGGWFKRSTQKYLFVAGFVAALAINFDVIQITKTIYSKADVRADILVFAESMQLPETKASSDEELKKQIKKSYDELNQFDLPIGWSAVKWEKGFWSNAYLFLKMLLGWILTGIAVTRGSTFWFNAMNKLINLRSSGNISSSNQQKSNA